MKCPKCKKQMFDMGLEYWCKDCSKYIPKKVVV